MHFLKDLFTYSVERERERDCVGGAEGEEERVPSWLCAEPRAPSGSGPHILRPPTHPKPRVGLSQSTVLPRHLSNTFLISANTQIEYKFLIRCSCIYEWGMSLSTTCTLCTLPGTLTQKENHYVAEEDDFGGSTMCSRSFLLVSRNEMVRERLQSDGI